MTNEEYVRGVLQTEAPVTDEVRARFADADFIYGLKFVMENFIEKSSLLDKYKKHFFYGKTHPDVRLAGLTPATWMDRESMQTDLTIRLMHSIIGICTEAGEMLNALHSHLYEGKPLDLVNIKEEFGDSFWYHGIGADVLQSSFEEFQRMNADKLLRRRYKSGKFTEKEATQRNLDEERRALEAQAQSQTIPVAEGKGDWNAILVNGDSVKIHYIANGFIYGYHNGNATTWGIDGVHIAPAPRAEWNLDPSSIVKAI